MKALFKKIRKILHNRRVRRALTRAVSIFAAVIVFVTTYALVLPAITMEKEAQCGIEAHQHDDSCYSEELICTIPESPGHTHTDACYKVDNVLTCTLEEHTHTDECYDEEGNLTCQLQEHVHDDSCYEEVRELTCGQEESEGHQHTSACYEKVLTCTKEVHVHSEACYQSAEETDDQVPDTDIVGQESQEDQEDQDGQNDQNDQEDQENKVEQADQEKEQDNENGNTADDPENVSDESTDDDAADGNTEDTDGKPSAAENQEDAENNSADGTSVDTSGTDASGTDTSGTDASGTDTSGTDASGTGAQEAQPEDLTGEAQETEETTEENYVPQLDALDMAAVLTEKTGFYYFHAEEGEEIPADSSQIPADDWKELKKDTVLASADLVKAYFAYKIPAGSLNETNQTARLRLPGNLRLTDDQIRAINSTENGIALSVDSSEYRKYLGAEAVEGTRTPDETLSSGAQEYISAVVRAENVYENMYDSDGSLRDESEWGDYIGQDLIFVFTPYTIQKNQNTYDNKGESVTEGEKVRGWFTVDFNMSQIDWEEEETTVDDAGNTVAERTAEIVFVQKDKDRDIDKISEELTLTEIVEYSKNAETDETAENSEETDNAGDASTETDSAAADSTQDAAAAATEQAADAADTSAEAAESSEEEEVYVSGTIEAAGDGYSIYLSYGEDAQIPEGASLSVREITEASDPETYAECLEQARQQVADKNASGSMTEVDQAASRFFDIEIIVTDTDEDGNETTRKIEPAAPVSVRIQLSGTTADAGASSQDDDASDETVSGQTASGQTSSGDPTVLHFAQDGVESMDATVGEAAAEDAADDEADTSVTDISFEAESFSIYGVVYTVDFSWEVDGEMYEYSLYGGDSASFRKLVEVLGIAHTTNETDSEDENGDSQDNIDDFVNDIEDIQFSDPDLLWAGKISEEMSSDGVVTAGQIAEAKGLTVEYSAELSEEQKAELTAKEYSAGEWVLLSLKPFLSKETLTVTMKTGEVFTIKVTDAQIKKTVMTASGETYEITVTYGDDAGIPEDSELKVEEILQEDDRYQDYYEKALQTTDSEAASSDNEEATEESVIDSFSDAVSELANQLLGGDEEETDSDDNYARFFDIEIWSREEKIEPQADVFVNIRLLDAPEDDELAPAVVHFAENGPELMDLKEQTEDGEEEGLTFTTDSFSVYGVIYTVDFSFEINGKVYGFSMEGADTVSLRALISALHVYESNGDNSEDVAIQQNNENNQRSEDQYDTTVIIDDLPDTDTLQSQQLDNFMSNIANVSFSDESLLVPVKVEEETTAGKIKTEMNLFPTYPLGLNQSEILALNAKEYSAGDWILISMKAFDTEETLTVTMQNGDSFSIHVTDAQDAVMVGDQVQTISNPTGTTIDLFDYWVVRQDLVSYDGWGDLNQGQGSAEAGDDKPLNGTGNNKGINSSTSDTEHGHALKFVPAWTGTVYNGSKIGTTGNAWQSVNLDGRDGLNSYTGGVNPFQGIVENTLINGYPQLTNNQTIGTNGENLAYLFSTSEDYAHVGKKSYAGVNQLLYVDKDGYYTYDSRDYAAAFDTTSKTFTVTEQTSGNSEIRGFWPFGIQNFWVGMHMNTQFSMPTNGKVLNPKSEYQDMQFEFSGDDDTWLYIDGVLVGDGGGIHNRTEIDINFASGTVAVTGQDVKYLDDIFTAAGRYNDEDWEDIGDGSGHKRFKAGTYHTFDMYYLERGGGESNLYIHYNLVSTADFTAHKAYTGFADDERMSRDQFQFEIIGLDGQYQSVYDSTTQTETVTLLDENGAAIMPTQGTATGAGTVASPRKEYKSDAYTDSSGEVHGGYVFTTGVTEDGNVNFGTAEISETEMYNCDYNHPSLYRYIIREVVPDDAKNDDGVTWVAATDEQKAAGGFIKDQVRYDGTIYYMTARVTSWNQTGTDGQTYTAYGLSKTYYTDDTFTTVRDDVTFVSFENTYAPDEGKVEFTKVVEGLNIPLQGAQFTLYMDKACTKIANDLDGVEQVITSGADGSVVFDNMAAPRTYYMKETEAPEGYKLEETVYKVQIVSSSDTDNSSVITVADDENQTPVTTISNTKYTTEGLEVYKYWQGGSPSDDATIVYKLYQTSYTSKDGEYTVDVSKLGYGKPDWSNARLFTNEELTGDKTGIKKDSVIEIAITTTSGGWSFDTLYETTKITSNQTIISDTLEEMPNGKDKRRVLRIQVTSESDNTISLYGQLESCYEGNGGKPTISSTIISEPDTSVQGDTKLVGMVTLGKSSVSASIEEAFRDCDPQIIVIARSADWTSVVKNLPEELKENGWTTSYKYYVEEVENSIPSGYSLGTISSASAVPGDSIGILNIKDAPEVIDVTIKKTDNADNSTNFLENAVFKLEYKATSEETVWTAVSKTEVPELNDDSQFTVPKNGITLTGLTDGMYRLQEVTPPDGYVITNSYPVIFTVANGAISNTDGTITGVRYTADSTDPTFIIPNEPGAALPNTGGPGTRLFTILGSMLLLGAGTLLLMRRRRLSVM